MRFFPARAKVDGAEAPVAETQPGRRTEIMIERECVTQIKRTYIGVPADIEADEEPAFLQISPDG